MKLLKCFLEVANSKQLFQLFTFSYETFFKHYNFRVHIFLVFLNILGNFLVLQNILIIMIKLYSI